MAGRTQIRIRTLEFPCRDRPACGGCICRGNPHLFTGQFHTRIEAASGAVVAGRFSASDPSGQFLWASASQCFGCRLGWDGAVAANRLGCMGRPGPDRGRAIATAYRAAREPHGGEKCKSRGGKCGLAVPARFLLFVSGSIHRSSRWHFGVGEALGRTKSSGPGHFFEGYLPGSLLPDLLLAGSRCARLKYRSANAKASLPIRAPITRSGKSSAGG